MFSLGVIEKMPEPGISAGSATDCLHYTTSFLRAMCRSRSTAIFDPRFGVSLAVLRGVLSVTPSRSTIFADVSVIKLEDLFSPLFNAILYSMSQIRKVVNKRCRTVSRLRPL